jgi:hypothetical protein
MPVFEGISMGKASAPAAPDYAGAAQQTAAGNLENSRVATSANRVNTYTPYGSLTYSQDPNNQDKWSSTIALSPQQQALEDQQAKTSAGLAGMTDAATGRVGQMMGQSLPGTYDPTQATNNASDLINARLLPQQERDQQSMDTKLANQGITQGSEAWKNAQGDLGRTQNDARQQAQLAGINLGQGQQAQMWQQAMANRNVPINELNALRTGSQVTNPTFSNAPQQGQVGGPDLLNAANMGYNAQMQGVNAQNANSAGMFGGLTKLAGMAGMFSDRRLKTDIRYIGEYKGHSWYEYTKFGQRETGVMAQEVLQTNPGAVSVHPSGYLMVNYGAL